MKINPHHVALGVFAAGAFGALVAFLIFGLSAFIAVAVVTMIAAGAAFAATATPDEKRADLEDRVRNPPE